MAGKFEIYKDKAGDPVGAAAGAGWLPPSGATATYLWATFWAPQIFWFAGFQFSPPFPHRLRCQFRWSVLVRRESRKGVDLNGVRGKNLQAIQNKVRDRFGWAG